MTTFPRSPKVFKGVLITLDPFNPLASVIVFQYNPETLERSLEARVGTDERDGSKTPRLQGAPKESIKLEIEIDATDQLEKSDPLAVATGIHPQLAALEMMLYPKSAYVIASTVAAFAGTLTLVAPPVPLTLFVWGPLRVLPVRVGALSINEEAYDPMLNPIRASVSLTLNVLSYSDLSITDPAYYLFLAHQIAKEVMATTASALSIAGSVSASFEVEV